MVSRNEIYAEIRKLAIKAIRTFPSKNSFELTSKVAQWIQDREANRTGQRSLFQPSKFQEINTVVLELLNKEHHQLVSLPTIEVDDFFIREGVDIKA